MRYIAAAQGMHVLEDYKTGLIRRTDLLQKNSRIFSVSFRRKSKGD